MMQQEIAEVVAVNQPTISRELRRNRGERGYRHKQAHHKATERKNNATKAKKMTASMIILVEEKLRGKWNPEQISGWLLEEQGEALSHERIYQHIFDKYLAGNKKALSAPAQRGMNW